MHPPWANGVFWLVWVVTASVGPIVFLVGLVTGSGAWWIGLLIYVVALVTMAVDAMVVRRRGQAPGWRPYEPPTWGRRT
jgi:hypothetical protein